MKPVDLVVRHFSGNRIPGNPIAYFKAPNLVDSIGESTVLRSSIPANAHPTMQQVKGSGFAGAGSATVTGLLTTDTITATGDAPTCSVNGTLTLPGPDCWDVYVHRAGVLWAYWPGINVGQTTELDASGNGHHLTALTTTTITERLDDTGTDYCNDNGFSSKENRLPISNPLKTGDIDVITTGIAIVSDHISCPGSTGAAEWAYIYPDNDLTTLTVTFKIEAKRVDSGVVVVGASTNPDADFAIRADSTTISTATSEELADGWYRFTVSRTATDPTFAQYGIFKWTGHRQIDLEFRNLVVLTGDNTAEYTRGLAVSPGRQPVVSQKTYGGTDLIVCAGDSTTVYGGYGYPMYLYGQMPNVPPVVNAGVGGNTSAQLLARIPDILALYPDRVIVLIGVNDSKQSIPSATTLSNIASIVSALLAANVAVILGTATPYKNGLSWSEGNQALLSAVRDGIIGTYSEYPGVTVVDTYSAMGDTSDPDALNALYDSGDGTHENEAGAIMLATLFHRALGSATIYTDTSGRVPQYSGPLRRDLIVIGGANRVSDGNCEAAMPKINSVSINLFNVTAALSSERANSGIKSLKITKTNTSPGASTSYLDGSNCGLTSGAEYYSDVWVYLPSAQTVGTLILWWRNKAGVDTELARTTLTDQWVKLSGTFVDDDSARILYVQAASDTVAGEYWYLDDLRIMPTENITYPDLIVTASLGPKFQALPEWTNNAEVDLSLLEATENTRLGTQGIAIWNPALDATGIVRADQVLKP
jgi:lysophospholipase L1-like esterase